MELLCNSFQEGTIYLQHVQRLIFYFTQRKLLVNAAPLALLASCTACLDRPFPTRRLCKRTNIQIRCEKARLNIFRVPIVPMTPLNAADDRNQSQTSCS